MSLLPDFTHTITTFLLKIADLQQENGLFSSYRKNPLLGYRRADTNVFYAANIALILEEAKPFLSRHLQIQIEQICERIRANYPCFRNKDGLETYNFWKTQPSQHFPHGHIFRHFDHFRIPDDIDDTALVYLTSNRSQEQVVWLKEKLKFHANTPPRFVPKHSEQNTPPQTRRGMNSPKTIKNTFPHYQHLRVYSTWFGKNMPIEFDVCALCNLMLLILKSNLPLNEYDIDTLEFLTSVIENDEFINTPFRVAHNYATTPLIIYHYARLMGQISVPQLELYRQKLIKTATTLLEKEQNDFNKIILETALMRLDNDYCLNPQSSILNPQSSNFRYFIAGLLSSYESPIAQILAPLSITQMQWECEAHNYALILENLVCRMKILEMNN